MNLLPDEMLNALKARYAEPHRAYHSWHHVEALLRWMNSGEFSLHHPDAVHCAILFHDAIYDPLRKDNEELSAQLAEEELKPYLAPEQAACAAMMIRATTTHQMVDGLDAAQNADLAHFLDMDLSILGADQQVFDMYETNVRAEYSVYPDDIFWPGRAEFLENFLKRDRLYFSEWGYDRFEAKARENLSRSIEHARQRLSQT
jgi:predicted metal-dependent HD superfamily phosphohydrolase